MKKSYSEKLIEKVYSIMNMEEEQEVLIQMEENKLDSSAMDLKFKRRKFKTHSFIFPLAYFITAVSTTFLLIFMTLIKDSKSKNSNHFLLHPLPSFYTLNLTQPLFFNLSVLTLALIGLLNVWFYCSMLLQRFSVPELQRKKIGIHTMFVLGILANLIYIFFGFSESFLKVENIIIKDVKISLSTITFLVFVFFNILFALFSVLSLQALYHHTQDCHLQKETLKIKEKIKTKRFVIYLAAFVMALYILSVAIRNHEQLNEYHKKQRTHFTFLLELTLFIVPYALFFINAFINLSFYSDVIYIQDSLMTIIDKEYFEPDDLEYKNFDCVKNSV